MSVAGNVVAGTLTATNQVVGPYQPIADRPFNLFLTGTWEAQVAVQRSSDQGVTYTTLWVLTLSGPVVFTGPCNTVLNEPDAAVLYRIIDLNHTSGTVNVSIG